MESIALIAGSLYSIVFFVIFFAILKKSKFWVLFVSVEYFYVLGLGIFPIALSLGYADFPEELISYGNLTTLSALSFIHVIFYAVGALLGFFLCPRLKTNFSAAVERFSISLNIDPVKSIFLFLFFAFAAAILYVSLVGPERVFLGAAAARGGVLDEFAGFESYLFLTRFMYFGVYAVAFLPFVFARARSPLVYLVAFFFLGVSGYFILAARYMLFQCVVVPLLLYFGYSKKVSLAPVFSLVLLSCLGFLGVFYGKELPTVVANYLFNNGDFEFRYSDENLDFFKSFSQFFYSIDAGIRSFSENGPSISTDIFLGPLGVFPSSVFSNLGLSEFSYLLLDSKDRFACVNTKLIVGTYSSCFMPPYFIGASAYLMPLVGGVVFGFIRFFTYSVVSDCWERMAGREQSLAGVVLFSISVEQLMLFIPNSAAFVVFVWIVIFLLKSIGALRLRKIY